MLKNPSVRFAIGVLLAFLITFLLVSTGDITVINILVLTLMYVGLSSAWNLLSGYTGQLSLGHTAFFGIGGYTSSILLIELGITPWVGIWIGGLFGVLLALIIGLPSFRLKGPFFTLSTIAIAEMLRIVSVNWKDLTNGSAGIRIPFNLGPENMVFTNPNSYVYLMFVYAVIVVLFIYLIDRSKFGVYLRCIREEEDAATSIGINATFYKMIAFIISAFFTAIGGTLFAQYTLLVEPPSMFSINFSILIALVAIIGGMGSVWGPVIGAIFMIPLSETLRSTLGANGLPGLHLVIYGVVLILVIRLMPKGIFPVLQHLVENLRKKSGRGVVGETNI